MEAKPAVTSTRECDKMGKSRWLSESTVIRFFTKLGGKLDYSATWIYLPVRYGTIVMNLYRQSELPGKRSLSLEIHDARWTKRGNVHIVSYWGWPRSMKELQEIWNGIRETYGILGGVAWFARSPLLS